MQEIHHVGDGRFLARSTALVTGASSGIGLACAQQLAALGFYVFGASRTCFTSSQSIEWLHMDVTSDDSVQEGVAKVLKQNGGIDVLVNCAGYALAGALEDCSVEDARAQFDTNFFGAFRVCRMVLPQMRSRRSGLIINITSLGGLFGLPFQGLYCASKFALEGYTETLRLEMRPFGIRVVLVEPGDIRDTAISRNRTHASGSKTNPAYRNSFEATLRIIKKEESNGAACEKVAAALRRVVRQPNSRLRHTVGHFSQRLAAFAKRFASGNLFERIMLSYYRLLF